MLVPWRPRDDPPSLVNTLSTAAFDAGTLNALSAECTHHICQQVHRPQVQVQVQVLQICTRVRTSTKYYMFGADVKI